MNYLHCLCPGVDIRQDGMPAVLRDDGAQLVHSGLHSHHSQRRPLRRSLPRCHVDALPNTEAGVDGVGRHLAPISGRCHTRLRLRKYGLFDIQFVDYYHPRMRHGNAFGRICLSV